MNFVKILSFLCCLQSAISVEFINSTSKLTSGKNAESEVDWNDRPSTDQKSLLIVFDTTGSMSNDLDQLRAGAQDIVNTFSAKDENPIYNYVLSLFNDPTVEDPLVTRDPEVLLTRLNAVKVEGGGDCPELALRGLSNALAKALPNSQAFLFSDASAKDYELYDEIAELIQRRQANVNFLLTGDCGEPTGPGFKVYEKIARTGGGQVFKMGRTSVREVLVAMSVSLENDFVSLKSLDLDEAGTSLTTLELDDTISRLSVSLSGRSAKLSIRDSKNIEVLRDEAFSSENIQIVTFNVTDNKYTIEASAQSAFSLRVGGNSDLSFDFGFSRQKPTIQSETYIRPANGHKNILSIFVSDLSLIKSLDYATIVPASTLESFEEIEVSLTQENGFFSTALLEIPEKMFRIRIHGFDSAGNVIDRIISTGIESVSSMIPDVEIDYKTLSTEVYGEIILDCVVKSLTIVNVTWMFGEDRILAWSSAEQSTNVRLTVKTFGQENVGNYSCTAVNDVGRDSKQVSLRLKPTCSAECPLEGFGFVPSYKDCTKFYECVQGIQYPMFCPEGKLFDSISNSCSYPESSVCASSSRCIK